MKQIVIISLFLIPLSIFSQELDPEYLATLPEGVREDLINKKNAKDEMEKPIYRRASSMTDKGELEIEEMKKSQRFGAMIFDVMQSSFMPINEPNFDDSYILDFGDSILLQLIGQEDSIEELDIQRDGSINIPDIGKLYIAGLSLESASNLIKSKISNAFIGTEAFISLVSVRDIQVLIAGNSYNPGVYTLNGNSNAIHALSMAGGVDKNGSYRQIDIIRDDEVIETIDLYDIFIFGKSSFGPKLRTGDSIFVRPSKALVNASSGIRRPNIYELKDGETFKDLITFANGVSDNIDSSYIAIERFTGKQIDLMLLDSIEELGKLKVQAGDTLFIREYVFRTVTVEGAVNVPGTYVVNEGETLSNVISRAGGYTEFAYPFGGFLNNQKTLNINEDAKERLYNKFLENLLLGTTVGDNDNFPFVLEQLRNTPISGRVMAEFDLDVLEYNKELDTTLEDNDEIIIPYITQQVYIYGQVNNSGTIRYSPGKDITFYIDNAGGFLNQADKNNIFVIHPNGKTVQVNKNSSRLSFLSSKDDLLIYPGSIIYVPRESIVDPVSVASIWAPIVSSLALTLTSLSVLDGN